MVAAEEGCCSIPISHLPCDQGSLRAEHELLAANSIRSLPPSSIDPSPKGFVHKIREEKTQLRTIEANPHVAGQWLSPGKPTRRAVATMGSNDLVVGEDHMLGPSFQRYFWLTGRCGSMAFGSSPSRGKTLISNTLVLRKYPLVEKTSRDILEEKSGVEPLKAVC